MRIAHTLSLALVAGLLVGCTESETSQSGESGESASTDTAGRQQIRIVGSSTVYPFSSYVAEEFGATSEHPTPVIESTGSGGGMKIFCEGDDLDTVDITNASRRMMPSEFERCADNGVDAISEFAIGADGITVAQAESDSQMNLTLQQLTLAVAAEVPRNGELVDNPYSNWSEIDPSLPDREITIYGPPSTSGTRDAFEELVMEATTEEMAGYDEPYTSVRDDGVYVDSGENDNLIVQKIQNDRQALGLFGYSFLTENTDVIDAVTINGVEPSAEAISSGEYPIARSLFFYAKNSHFDRISGMEEYVSLFLSEQMIGEQGLLKDEGLIPLPRERREAMRQRLEQREPLAASDLDSSGH